jgi:two-component system sensor histidine kinase CiaH
VNGRFLSPQRAHAARVALAASLLVCIVYAACVTILDKVITVRLLASVDARLQDRLADVAGSGLRGSVYDSDPDAPPVYLWRVTSRGPVTDADTGAPSLPASLLISYSQSWTVVLRQGSFRLSADRGRDGSFIVGQSIADQDHLLAALRDGEALAAPVLLLAMFAGALTIGLRALSPVEQSRRRQLEFTADASHELRTPLSVITAETSIALSAPRDPADYQAALTRIERESGRLQRIVEDMLWLARFDSAPPQPGYQPLDLATIAADCAERFRVLAASKGFEVVVAVSGSEPALISAPPEWIDRLTGVLADNACRFAGPGGTVRLGVAPRGNRVCLTVEDTGPGVPLESRDRLFDRFHRSTELGGSAGLGLAIADSIVQTTGGQWRVEASDLGGALFEVSWRRATARQHSTSTATRSRSAPRAPDHRTDAGERAEHAEQPGAGEPEAAQQA